VTVPWPLALAAMNIVTFQTPLDESWRGRILCHRTRSFRHSYEFGRDVLRLGGRQGTGRAHSAATAAIIRNALASTISRRFEVVFISDFRLTREAGRQRMGFPFYQVHLYHWLETNGYGRYLVDKRSLIKIDERRLSTSLPRSLRRSFCAPHY